MTPAAAVFLGDEFENWRYRFERQRGTEGEGR